MSNTKLNVGDIFYILRTLLFVPEKQIVTDKRIQSIIKDYTNNDDDNNKEILDKLIDIIDKSYFVDKASIVLSIIDDRYYQLIPIIFPEILSNTDNNNDNTFVVNITRIYELDTKEIIHRMRRFILSYNIKDYMFNYKKLDLSSIDYKLKRIVSKHLSKDDLDFKNMMASIMNNNIHFKPSDVLMYENYDLDKITNIDSEKYDKQQKRNNDNKNKVNYYNEFRNKMNTILSSKFTKTCIYGGCVKCSLRKNDYVNLDIVINDHNRPNEIDVLIVGMNPYIDEIKTGKPFSGRSGKMLRDSLKEYFDANNINYAITNTVMCFIPDNKDPTIDDIKHCFKLLDFQIYNLNPKIIIPLGKIAIERIVKPRQLKIKESVSKYVGQTFSYKVKDREFIVIPNYHPSAIVRNRNKYGDVFKSVFKKITALLNSDNNINITKTNHNQNNKSNVVVININTVNELEDFLSNNKSSLVVIDVFVDKSNNIYVYCKNKHSGGKVYLNVSNMKYRYYELTDINKYKPVVDITMLNERYSKLSLKDLLFNNDMSSSLNKPTNFNSLFTPQNYALIESYKAYNYRQDESDFLNSIKILYFDIEVFTNYTGVADEHKADQPITCISYVSSDDEHVHIMLNRDFFNKDNINIDNVKEIMYNEYHNTPLFKENGGVKFKIEWCDNEKDLLNKFAAVIRQHDLITAWNIGFDITYICNRLIRNNMSLSILSPIGVEARFTNKTFYKIPGIMVFDALEVYKKYVRSRYYSFSLDAIADLELGLHKVRYENKLDDVLKNEPNKYIAYSIIDSQLLKMISEKTGMFELMLLIKNFTCISSNNVFMETFLIQNLMYIYASYDNKALASVFYKFEKMDFKGGFVREPKKGLIHWVIDSDASSMYPSLMITLNLSPETFYGQIISLTLPELEEYLFNNKDDDIDVALIVVDGYNLKKKYMKISEIKNKVKNKEWYIAPSGAIYVSNKVFDGLIPKILNSLIKQRKEAKDIMLELKEKGDPNYKRYDIIQLTKKKLANSFFGANGAKFFRYYSPYIAQSITLTAQYLNKYVSGILDYVVEQYVKIGDPTISLTDIKFDGLNTSYLRRSENQQYYVFYSDTDSSFVHIEDMIVIKLRDNDKYKNFTDQQIREDLRWLLINNNKVKHLNEKDVLNVAKDIIDDIYNLINFKIIPLYAKVVGNEDGHRFKYKSEYLYKSMYSIAKKKYVFYMIEREGKPIKEFGSVNAGIKSDYAPLSNEMILDISKTLIFTNADVNELMKKINEWEQKFRESYKNRELIGLIPVSFNKDLSEYKDIKHHVKAMLLYNVLVRKSIFKHRMKGYLLYFKDIKYNMLNLTYDEFNKILMKFTKEYGTKSGLTKAIAIPSDLEKIPEWIEIDIETMLDKTLYNKLNELLSPIMNINKSKRNEIDIMRLIGI